MNQSWQVGISGGTVERDESPEEALIRELQEELSLRATIVKKAGVWTHTYPFLHVEIHGFLVEAEIWTISRCPFIVR